MSPSYPHQAYLAQRPDGRTLDGTPGDCYRTCVAILVDQDRDAVPHAVLFGDSCDDVIRRHVRATRPGWDLGWYLPTPWPLYADPDQAAPCQQLAIATGPSPRGPFLHCVVVDAFTGDLVHDPHPSGAGLAGDITTIDVLVPAYDPPPADPIALPAGPSSRRAAA